MNDWPIERELDERLREMISADVQATDLREIALRTRTGRRGSLAAAGVAVAVAAVLVASLMMRAHDSAPVGASQTPSQTETATASASASPMSSSRPTTTLIPGLTPGATASSGSASGKSPDCAPGILVPLADGRVLIAQGSCGAIFDPSTRTFSATGPMTTDRTYATTTLLADGRVLVAGGLDGAGSVPTSDEIFDPRTGRFTPISPVSPANPVASALLSDGRVLLIDGESDTAAIFDPVRGTFAPAGSIPGGSHAGVGKSAVRLRDGRILVADAPDGEPVQTQIYDPATDTFTVGATATVPRDSSASLARLPDGRVLLFGGGSSVVEAFDPSTDTFARLTSMPGTARVADFATLSDGRVLAITVVSQQEGFRTDKSVLLDLRPAASPNGEPYGATVSLMLAGELYDPAADKWTDLGALAIQPIADYGAPPPRLSLIAPLPNGAALVIGGSGGGGGTTELAELFNPATDKFALNG